MIVKIHKRGSGGGSGPVDYLLGKDRNRELADVLRGNPEQTKEIIDSLDFKRKYTSGVLSFEESDIPEEHKQALMDELERHLLCGLDANQYECLWVQHQDKGRLELNFLIPNVELTTGKRLQPYYDKIDRARNDAFQTYMNGKFNLSDPNNPSKKRTNSYAHDLPEERKKVADHITNGLMAMVTAGEIKNRDDVIASLESNGFTIARKTKKSISIRAPGREYNTRLNGGIYEQSFTASPSLRAEIEADSERFSEQLRQRTEQARKLYEQKVREKSEYNRKRYQTAKQEVIKSVREAPQRTQQRIEEVTKQNTNDVQPRLDTRNIGNGRTVSTGLEISNINIKRGLEHYERSTETVSLRSEITATTTRKTKQRIRGTSESISATIKRLAESIGRYAESAIKLGSLRREKRYERESSFRLGR